jgi:hypothetical protein
MVLLFDIWFDVLVLVMVEEGDWILVADEVSDRLIGFRYQIGAI